MRNLTLSYGSIGVDRFVLCLFRMGAREEPWRGKPATELARSRPSLCPVYARSMPGLAYYPGLAGLERSFEYDCILVSAVRRGHPFKCRIHLTRPWYGPFLYQ